MPFLGVMLGDEDEQHQRSNVGYGLGCSLTKILHKLYQPMGLSGRDDVPPVRIIFLLQHIINTNQFFSVFCTVFAGIFPGGGSTVTFGKSDSHISTSVSIKKLWFLMHSCKKSTLWLKSNFFCETRDSPFSQNNKIQIRKRIPGP